MNKETLEEELKRKNELMLKLEEVIGVTTILAFLSLIVVVSFYVENVLVIVLSSIIATLILVLGVSVCIKIEQTAGFYECSICKHKYVPTYLAVFWAIHFGRTRYMKCPKCGKNSWNKKKIE